MTAAQPGSGLSYSKTGIDEVGRAFAGALGVGRSRAGRRPLEAVPAVVGVLADARRGREVDLLAFVLADVADPEVAGLAIEGEAEGVAQPEAPDVSRWSAPSSWARSGGSSPADSRGLGRSAVRRRCRRHRRSRRRVPRRGRSAAARRCGSRSRSGGSAGSRRAGCRSGRLPRWRSFRRREAHRVPLRRCSRRRGGRSGRSRGRGRSTAGPAPIRQQETSELMSANGFTSPFSTTTICPFALDDEEAVGVGRGGGDEDRLAENCRSAAP